MINEIYHKFYSIQDALEEFVYVLFMVIVSGAIVFIFFFVPETKNKTFREIAELISPGRRSKGRGGQYGRDSEELQPMRKSPRV